MAEVQLLPPATSTSSAGQHQETDLMEVHNCKQEDLGSLHAHNRLMPISRLNAEVLKHIFLFVKPDDLETPTTKWFQFSHVCAYWRRVALDFPFLWSTIFLDNLAATETLLLRSSSVALSVVSGALLTSRGNTCEAQVSVIHSCAGRIRHLKLHGGVGLQSLLRGLDMALPVLETVSIASTREVYTIVLSGPLFPGTAPMLTSLSLSCFQIPNGLDSLALDLPRLRALRLVDGICPLDSALSALAALEIFVWQGRPRSGELPELEWMGATIRWPRLRRLELVASYASAATFLAALQIPPSAKIGLECQTFWESARHMDAAAILGDVLRARGHLGFRANIDVKDRNNLDVRVCSVDDALSDLGGFSLLLHSPNQPAHLVELLGALPVRHAIITSTVPFATDDGIALMGALLAETRTLELRGLFCGKLVAILIGGEAPMLESLVLDGMRVETRREDIGKAVVVFEDLLQFTQGHSASASRGALEKLGFVNCKAESDAKRQEWVDELSQGVRTEWM